MTAVSWLQQKIKETYDKEGKLPLGYVLNLVSQAKAMECDQIIKAFIDGEHQQGFEGEAEQYFNETYKNK